MLGTKGHGALRIFQHATYCDTGHTCIMAISEDPWHLHLLPSVQQWSCHYLFLRLTYVAAGIRTPNFPHAGQTLWLRHRRGNEICRQWQNNKMHCKTTINNVKATGCNAIQCNTMANKEKCNIICKLNEINRII